MATTSRKERIDRAIKARSDDIFLLSSYREILYLLLPRVIPVIAIISFPLLKDVVGLYWQKVMVITCTVGILGLSWDLLASVGLISLGQSFFFGVGAYLAAFFDSQLGLSSFLSICFATVGGAVVCTLFLFPLTRLKGIYFALITLAIPMLFMRVIEAGKIMGGEEGVVSLSGLPNFWVETYVPIFAVLICLFGFRRLIITDYGLVLRAINDNDRAVMARAINIHHYKAQVVFLAGLTGSFAGAFLTEFYQFAGTSSFGLDYSILPLTCAILGGPGSFAGSVLGAFILVPISEILRAFGPLRMVFYSAILFVFVVGVPEGVFDYLQRKYHQFERKVSVDEEG